MTERPPDVEIAAAVTADQLRFERKPEVRVVAYADSPAWAESTSDRENLPDELEPGVTYTNFAVRWHAAARLSDPDAGGRAAGPQLRADARGEQQRRPDGGGLECGRDLCGRVELLGLSCRATTAEAPPRRICSGRSCGAWRDPRRLRQRDQPAAVVLDQPAGQAALLRQRASESFVDGVCSSKMCLTALTRATLAVEPGVDELVPGVDLRALKFLGGRYDCPDGVEASGFVLMRATVMAAI